MRMCGERGSGDDGGGGGPGAHDAERRWGHIHVRAPV